MPAEEISFPLETIASIVGDVRRTIGRANARVNAYGGSERGSTIQAAAAGHASCPAEDGLPAKALDGRIALDRIDLQILAILQREGRISKAELAERVGLSPSTCHERMRRLQKQKAILSYHANVNLRAIAHTQTFFVEVTLKTHRAYDFRRFESFIAKVPEIVECHALGGGIDYLVKVVARTHRRLSVARRSSAGGRDRH